MHCQCPGDCDKTKKLRVPSSELFFRNGGKDNPNLLPAILSTKTITNTPLQLLHQVGTRKTCHVGSQSTLSAIVFQISIAEKQLGHLWIPCEYQMNTLSNVMNHDSQFWFRLRFQVMWLQRWLWWTQWPKKNPGHQRGQAPCDISLPKERENGHLIYQSHGLEVHFCFGFSVFFGSWGHFWEYFVPFAHQERQMKILKMWASDISISQLLKDPSNLMLGGSKPGFLEDYALCFGKLRPKQRVQKKHW